MLKRLIQKFIRIIQKILITFSLTVVYFLGLGITLIFIALFNRKIITSSSKDDDTFWVGAEGYQQGVHCGERGPYAARALRPHCSRAAAAGLCRSI